jgi:hypothetical protein
VSIEAVRGAISWYAATLAQAPGAPLGAERAAQIAKALHAKAPCDPLLFDDLVTLGRLMHRLSYRPGVPVCNVGDVLVAAAGLPAVCGESWESDAEVDPSAYAKLGFAATSRGIADAEQNNRSGWRSHTERCRSYIDAASDLAPAKECAVVVGVGRAFDLPLASLAQSFDRLVLIDVDADTLEATAEAVKRTGPRASVETKCMDVTGINRTMVAAIDRIVETAQDPHTVPTRIEEYVRSYRIIPPVLSERRADLLVSSCVVSQLAWPGRAYALARVRERGSVEGEAERAWSRAWFEHELRVQQDHIRACSEGGRITVLISDMAHRMTAFDAGGLERPTGGKTFTLGVDSLLERIPRSLRAERHASWLWPRHRPGPTGEPGSWTEVEATVLYERSNTIA